MRVYRVYIVDDEGWIVIGLKKKIEKSGYPFKVIGTANNGVTALEEIEKADPDVIFMDIRMPGYDGLELLEHLRDQGKSCKGNLYQWLCRICLCTESPSDWCIRLYFKTDRTGKDQ